MQIPEHVQRGHLSPNDKAWGKKGVPTPVASVARSAKIQAEQQKKK